MRTKIVRFVKSEIIVIKIIWRWTLEEAVLQLLEKFYLRCKAISHHLVMLLKLCVMGVHAVEHHCLMRKRVHVKGQNRLWLMLWHRLIVMCWRLSPLLPLRGWLVLLLQLLLLLSQLWWERSCQGITTTLLPNNPYLKEGVAVNGIRRHATYS